MVSCSVKKCSVNSYHIKQKNLPIKLHQVPKGGIRRKKWFVFCGIVHNNKDVPPIFVCSKHFKPDDYHNFHDPDIHRRILTRDAVPSIRDPSPHRLSDRNERARRKSREQLVNSLLEAHQSDNVAVGELPECLKEIVERNPLLRAVEDEYRAKQQQSSYFPEHKPESDHPSSSGWEPLLNGIEKTTTVPEQSSSDFIMHETGQMEASMEIDMEAGHIDTSNCHGGMDQESAQTMSFNPVLHSTVLNNEGANEANHDSDFNLKLLCDITLRSEHTQHELNGVDIDEEKSGQNHDSPYCPMFAKIFDSMDNVNQGNDENANTKRGSISRLNTIIKHQRQTIRNLKMQLRGRDLAIKKLNIKIRQQQQKSDDLTSDNQTLRKACTEMSEVPEIVIRNRIRSAFLTIFTPNQTDLILGVKRKVVWTSAEIAMAFSLRYHSQPGYEIVRRDMRIPLPSLRSLREWGSCIDMRKGILEDVLTVLKLTGKYMTERERVVILGFDEMSVSNTIELDKRNDEVVGPHKEMQVISARSLFSPWKQPIYANFDQRVTLSILNEIITRLHEIGFNVVGNVHDCGGGNLALWKEIGIDFAKEQTSMKHPVTKEDIFFFPDAPHLLKLIRNWLLDSGFYYKGKLVTKLFLVKLVEKASTLQKPMSKGNPEFRNVELNSLFKISIKHLTVQKSERQNVRLAAELLSHTTAVNLRRHFGDYEEAMLLAEIIEKVNLWFDVMNSYQLSETIASKKCYGMDLTNQNKILDDMATLMKDIRTLNRHCLPHATHLQIFQKAILVSIVSVKKLFLNMQAKYDVFFLMTYKLNQDFIENLFAILRLNGGTHDHPSPLKALDRLRLVFLGKNLPQLKRNQNTQNNLIDEEFVMARIYRKKRNCRGNSGTTDCIFEDDDDEPWQFVPRERPLEEVDGTEYAAGYVARGLLKEFPDLANYTHSLEQEAEEGVCSENYVQDLSYGGLLQPTESWNNVYNQMNSYFDHIHNKARVADGTEEIGFRNPKDVQKRSITLMQKQFPEVPEKVIKKYVKNRINIRVKHLKKRLDEKKIHKYKIGSKKNASRKENSTNKEHLKERDAALRQNSRKLKHFIN